MYISALPIIFIHYTAKQKMTAMNIYLFKFILAKGVKNGTVLKEIYFRELYEKKITKPLLFWRLEEMLYSAN